MLGPAPPEDGIDSQWLKKDCLVTGWTPGSKLRFRSLMLKIDIRETRENAFCIQGTAA